MKTPLPVQYDGVLVLDKPSGPTSADCLNRIKRTLKQKKIGHAGTLDPMATGLLVVLLGQGTKLASFLSENCKTYQGTLRLGEITDTYDIQGKTVQTAPWGHISPADIEKVVSQWRGTIAQEVPPVSAAKHQGKPLYALHRSGQDVPVKIKNITLFDAQILHMDLPSVTFRVTCSSGTYIRSLAHSLGIRLGCGAVLSQLEREASLPFTKDQAHPLQTVLAGEHSLQELAIPLHEALPHWPKLYLDDAQTGIIKNGGQLSAAMFPDYPAQAGDKAFALTQKGEPLALLEARAHAELFWTILRGLWPSPPQG